MSGTKISPYPRPRRRQKTALAVLAILLSACSTLGTSEPRRTPNTEARVSSDVRAEASEGGPAKKQDERRVEPQPLVEPPVTASPTPATALTPTSPQPTAATKPEMDALASSEGESLRKDKGGVLRSAPAKESIGALMGNGSGAIGHGVGAGQGYYGGAIAEGKARARLSRNASNGYVAAPSAPPADLYAALPTGEGNTERYSHQGDNPFEKVADSPLSTFSIDVDTASYSNVRRFLREGVRPPADAVRIEELVNYFRYDYPVPASDAPVAVSSEVSMAPWHDNHRLVRIGLRTRDIASENAPASNLVFLIDVSGSMQSEDKLPLLKRGLGMLANQLRPQDRVSMVVYAGASGVVLPPTSGKHKETVREALERLDAGGSTNGADGIRLAYRVARDSFIENGVNRVILATDGDFNVGTTSEGELVRLIEEERKSGVSLTVLGFGRGNLNDSSMEKLADHGDGNYAYVDSIAEAHKVLVREAGSTLVTVAKDVKLQVEWNPKRVASYRLIGFENRKLAARDFNDDKKDAGEIGAGHTVTALYEVTLTERAEAHAEVDPLRYQQERVPSAAADESELLTVKIRYKRPSENESRLMTAVVRDAVTPLQQTSEDFRWAVAVAGFGMILRESEHMGQASLAMVKDLARSATGSDLHGERHELIAMMDQARALGIDAKTVAHTAKAK